MRSVINYNILIYEDFRESFFFYFSVGGSAVYSALRKKKIGRLNRFRFLSSRSRNTPEQDLH